ncbi:MAG: GNAT family N-acetyltransferase [Anaerolineae bacterium]|nr:GNAT family N-acetyltransferase [Anaerolineae bacterium]
MLPYPLTRANRMRLARAFASLPRVDISIECALEDQMGAAYVDSLDQPRAFMIEQDGFFCYYAGDISRDFVSATPRGRLLMAGAPGWQAAVENAFGDALVPIERHTFASEALSVDHLRSLAASNPHTAAVRRVDAQLARTETPYLSLDAFESAEDFVERGIGFCLLHEGTIVGGAYSSLVCSDAIEVSIVVHTVHRRQGVATALASQLLLWCLEHQIAPHWDAANDESCGLAAKLGYRKVGTYAAYYLK